MVWDEQTQARFDELRLQELTGKLSATEQAELAELMTAIEQTERDYMAPAIKNIRQEQAALREKLQTLQSDNEAFAMLLHQQEQLVGEAQQWLQEFQERHRQIHQRYTHLTGEILTTGQ